MGSSVPAAKSETLGNAALNGQETPSWPESEGSQFTLGSADSKCSLAASRMAALVKEAQRASDFTLGTVAHLAGKETPYVSKCLDAEDPHAALKMLCAVLMLDKSRAWLRGVAAMAGCEVVERPKLTPEQKLERLLDALERHGPMGRALIAEAMGEEP